MHNIEFHKRFADPATFFKQPCTILEELPENFDEKAWYEQYSIHMTKVLDRKIKAMMLLKC